MGMGTWTFQNSIWFSRGSKNLGIRIAMTLHKVCLEVALNWAEMSILAKLIIRLINLGQLTTNCTGTHTFSEKLSKKFRNAKQAPVTLPASKNVPYRLLLRRERPWPKTWRYLTKSRLLANTKLILAKFKLRKKGAKLLILQGQKHQQASRQK